MLQTKIKIIFWGTPYFSAKIMEALILANFNPILAITAPDKPKGRGLGKQASEVKRMAIKYGLNVSQPLKLKENPDFRQQLQDLQPDVFIVASYGKIIPKEILAIPKKGCLNIHPSLLPRWRGASPIQTTILAGDKKTGVTIILMDEEIDHGPIISNIQFVIPNPKITYKELEEKLIEAAAKLLIETLPKWLNNEIKPIPQDHSQATFCTIIKRADGKIDFNESAEIIGRKIRTFNPWPGTFFERNGKIYKILEGEISKNLSVPNKKVGEFFYAENDLFMSCGQDYLIIKKIQPESKKPLTGYQFWCGYQNKLK